MLCISGCAVLTEPETWNWFHNVIAYCYIMNHLGKNVTKNVQNSISRFIEQNYWATKAHLVNFSLSEKTHRISNQ